MKAEILKLLRETDEYISGQQLCDHFGVSRTAVWKNIGQLKQDGYEIEAVQNKGYRLLSSPDRMTAYELKSRIHTGWAGSTLYYFDETGSTNNDCKRFASEGAPHGTLVVADRQTAGKGRRGRVWQTPAGTSIAMSLLLRPDFSPEKASMLTLVMGLSMAQTVKRVTGLEAGIKWPNDVVVNGKKICGILTELVIEEDYIDQLVIGIGINVNNGIGLKNKEEAFPEDIRDMATSLYLESGRQISRAEIICTLMEIFEHNYDIYVRTMNLSELREVYNENLINMNRQVRVLDPKGEYEGVAKGIDAEGNLLVERADNGCMENVYSGEVSVRGLYGYV